MKSNVIAIAGLPGSGKSRVMDDLKAKGYSRYNDINRHWNTNLPKARSEAQQGRKVAISDIMFCDQSWRTRLEQELGLPIQWIFMQNDPWQCAKNCLFRFAFQKPHRPFEREIQLIRHLSPLYHPVGDIRSVPKADAHVPTKWV